MTPEFANAARGCGRLRVMLGIGPTSPYRLHAALRYTLEQVARSQGHVYLPLVELVDRTARQLDDRRATTGRWEPEAILVQALREYLPTFTCSEDAAIEPGSSGKLETDDTRMYSRELYEADTPGRALVRRGEGAVAGQRALLA